MANPTSKNNISGSQNLASASGARFIGVTSMRYFFKFCVHNSICKTGKCPASRICAAAWKSNVRRAMEGYLFIYLCVLVKKLYKLAPETVASATTPAACTKSNIGRKNNIEVRNWMKCECPQMHYRFQAVGVRASDGLRMRESRPLAWLETRLLACCHDNMQRVFIPSEKCPGGKT